MIHPSVEKALRVVQAHKHWIYKQAPAELEAAIQELVSFAKFKLELPPGDLSAAPALFAAEEATCPNCIEAGWPRGSCPIHDDPEGAASHLANDAKKSIGQD